MTAIKERILGAISVMSDSDAEDVWAYIITRFPSRSWDEIEETVPDEWDRAMLKEISENPECHEFISQDQVSRELGL